VNGSFTYTAPAKLSADCCLHARNCENQRENSGAVPNKMHSLSETWCKAILSSHCQQQYIRIHGAFSEFYFNGKQPMYHHHHHQISLLKSCHVQLNYKDVVTIKNRKIKIWINGT